MFSKPTHRLLPVVLSMLSALAPTAHAGHDTAGTAHGRPDPLDARAAVPPVVHESAFARYRPHTDTKLRPWKDANDNVGRIGGWRSYAREAAQEEPVAAPGPKASGSEGRAVPAPKAADGRHKH